jgi:hypothetical protein
LLYQSSRFAFVVGQAQRKGPDAGEDVFVRRQSRVLAVFDAGFCISRSRALVLFSKVK